jgi:adenylyltransferase/sulfurtransferase
MRFRELKVRRNPACPVCGPNRTIRELLDYDEFCGVRGRPAEVSTGNPEITPRELKARIDAGESILLLDVREPREYEMCHLDAFLIPLAEIPVRVSELDPSRDTVVYCRSGERSSAAVLFLKRAGFARVWNLRGGILAWADEVDPTFPKY